MRGLTLWRLRRKRKRLAKKYASAIDEAKDGDEAQAIMSEAMEVREDIRDKILHLRSLALADKAEDLGLIVPSYRHQRNLWEDGLEPGTVRLTQESQLKLQQAVRSEQRDRWSLAAFVLKEIVTPIIGVLGAIMGVLSLIHAFKSK
jgi:hypothetical protein